MIRGTEHLPYEEGLKVGVAEPGERSRETLLQTFSTTRKMGTDFSAGSAAIG